MPEEVVVTSTTLPMVSLRSVSKRFAGNASDAVHDLSLDVADGEVVVLSAPPVAGRPRTGTAPERRGRRGDDGDRRPVRCVAESQIMAELYAQMLEAAGYTRGASWTWPAARSRTRH